VPNRPAPRDGCVGPARHADPGGVGRYRHSTVGFVAAMEQIGLADQSVAAAWQAHVTIGSLPLYLFGNDAQRERWLPAGRGTRPRCVRFDRARCGFGRAPHHCAGVTARWWLADQRSKDVHLQRGHGHVVRSDAAGRHRVGRGAGTDVRELRRREGHPRLHHRPEDARYRLAGSRHLRTVLRRRLGLRRSPRPAMGLSSSWGRSRSGGSRLPPCRSA
jgi:hypothetical protein